jgi:hypothetical protein
MVHLRQYSFLLRISNRLVIHDINRLAGIRVRKPGSVRISIDDDGKISATFRRLDATDKVS